MTDKQERFNEKIQGAALVAGGAIAGAGVSAVVGGMELVGGFGGQKLNFENLEGR